jgi:hypothetical protein
MQYTLLEIVQTVLSSMDSDEVNSINDTVESQQVVEVVKTVYNDIVSRSNLAAHKIPFNLAASADSSKPVLMTKPTNISTVDWVKYDCRLLGETDPNWNYINFKPFDTFMSQTQMLSPSESDVDSMSVTSDGFTFTFHFKNNTAPSSYTTYNDSTLIFNAYDSAVDSTLQSSKSLGWGNKNLSFTPLDTFVPDLPDDLFSLLINEAKSLAWTELKQTAHAKAESTARRNWTHLSKRKSHIPSGLFNSGSHGRDMFPNFGRK